MIKTMRQIGLDFLYKELNGSGYDIEVWYEELRKTGLSKILKYLTEAISTGKKVVLVSADDKDSDLINVISTEVKEDEYYPFIKPSGSQSGQLGPVLKISYTNHKPGPSQTITARSIKKWIDNMQSQKEYSEYFRDILEILGRKKINYFHKEIVLWEDKFNNSLDCIIDKSCKEFSDGILVIKNSMGELPGESFAYSRYISGSPLFEKYETKNTLKITDKYCSLCNQLKNGVYANGLKGSGINIGNVDREGSFSGLNYNNSWKNYSICAGCADLLYIFKNHVLKSDSDGNRKFYIRIAGEKALLLPEMTSDYTLRNKLYKKMDIFLKKAKDSTQTIEDNMIRLLIEDESTLMINIYWLTIGQNIEDLHGSIQDILPSRMRILSEYNNQFNKIKSNLINNIIDFSLSLNGLINLFKRRSKKSKDLNKSKELKKIRIDIARCIYHKKYINEERFWNEIFITTKSYIDEIIDNGGRSYLELISDKTDSKKFYLSTWMRYLACWIYYMRKLEVMNMSKKIFKVESELLKPYFCEESGIDSKEKAFAFILGILFGRLILIQGAKGINVGSNALTWLKRLTLNGSDLPELYVKVREKLLVYEAEARKDVREVINELGRLGIQLGNEIMLDKISTNYFLLLGQSISRQVIKSKENDNEQEVDHV